MQNEREMNYEVNDGSLISKTYNSIRDVTKNVFNSGRRKLTIGATVGALAIGGFAHAEDPDRDGLSTIVEIGLGTNPNLADTDGDGLNDGMEFGIGTDPLDFDSNIITKAKYFINNQTEILGADAFNHRLMPVVSSDGISAAYVKTDSNFENAGIYYIPNINSPVEALLTDLDNFEYGQLSFDINKNFLYYHDSPDGGVTNHLFRWNFTTRAAEQLTFLDGEWMRDPEFVRYPRSSTLTPKEWIFAAVNDNISDVIAAYPVVGGNPDFNSRVDVIDIAGSLAGQDRWPRLDAKGQNMIHAVKVGSSRTNVRPFASKGIEDVLKRDTSMIINPDVGAARTFSVDISSGWHMPIGFSSTGKVYILAYDVNKVFDDNLNNFNAANFDLYVNTFEGVGVGGATRMPMEGNQFSGAINGANVLYSSDNNFSNDTMKNIYKAGVNSLIRINWSQPQQFLGEVVMEDLDGFKFTLPDLTFVTFPGEKSSHNGTMTMEDLPLGTNLEGDEVPVRKIFSPPGTTFDNGGVAEDVTLIGRYLDRNFTEEQEQTSSLVKVNLDGTTTELEFISRDTIKNTITAKMTGFSTIGVKSDLSAGPIDSDGDGLEDVVETNTGIYVSPTDTGTDPGNPDSDGDGLSDGAEVNQHNSNPNLYDTDGGGRDDGTEITHGFNVNDPADDTVKLSINDLANLLGGLAVAAIGAQAINHRRKKQNPWQTVR